MFNFQRYQDLDELPPPPLPTRAELSVASFFISASVRGSVMNILIYLAD
jgi:hypothetical protein